jgi:hypothetical protein
VLDYFLPSVQSQFFLEWTHTSFEQSVVKCCNVHLEEHLQVSLGRRWESVLHSSLQN